MYLLASAMTEDWVFELSKGTNRPGESVFSYSLATRQCSRLINTWTGAFDHGTVSKSGQYLAYVKGHHVAPDAGCVNSRGIYTGIEIVDLSGRTRLESQRWRCQSQKPCFLWTSWNGRRRVRSNMW
jgi:hypothetical protein